MNEQIIFWNGKGQISPHLMFEYLAQEGIGLYFSDDANRKNSDPILVKINHNQIVSPINVGYLLETAKNYILQATQEQGESGPVLDSLHKSTALFGDKNLKLLPTLKLEFISDTPKNGFFFFRNGIVQVTADDIQVLNYNAFDGYVWEQSIIPFDFNPLNVEELHRVSDFMKFLVDLTTIEDPEKAKERFESLASTIGYLLHRYKDASTNKAIILMDVYINGQPNGGSGKTLLITSIGKLRKLAIIDGKKYDQREWFALSSVDIGSEVLLFDDTEKDFNFEQIFPLMSTGMYVRRKYKDNVFIPFDKAPKVAITTNYAINGSSSSHRRRMHEFEISGTFSADYSPRDRYNHNFFDDWQPDQWAYFYNTMFYCLQVFLKNGLMVSDPINLSLTKLINKTCEEFIEFADAKLVIATPFDKKLLYDEFIKAFPEHRGKLKQRDFTRWLRCWGNYKNLVTTESHSGDNRFILFSVESKV